MYLLIPTRSENAALHFRMEGEPAERHGAIGYLRADFGRHGCEFWSNWFDCQKNLNTFAFQQELNSIMESLRNDGTKPPFASRDSAVVFCAANPGANLSDRGSGFFVRTLDYSYYFRLRPGRDDYDIYCFVYDNRFLLPELAGKHELPEKCFGIAPQSGALVLLTHGKSQYHAFSSTASPTELRLTVNELNGLLGVTRAQEEAMLTGSMFGWDVSGAKPWHYDEHGTPIK